MTILEALAQPVGQKILINKFKGLFIQALLYYFSINKQPLFAGREHSFYTRHDHLAFLARLHRRATH